MDRTHLSSSDSGSKDGSGAADNDQPYEFGRRPRSVAPWPFTERQYALLLMLRGRVADEPNANDQTEPQPIVLLDEGTRPAAAPSTTPDLLKKPRRRAA
jgi:hypothetical protein